MDDFAERSECQLAASVNASIPGYVFRFRRSPDGEEALDYVSAGFDEIWKLDSEEDRYDPSVQWSRVFDEDLEKFAASIQVALETGRWDLRYRIKWPGGIIRWLHGRGKLSVLDKGGFCVDGMILDITDQVSVEKDLEETRQRLSQAQKMETVGNLTAGVAHDFNNLLGVILGNTELMEFASDTADFEELREQVVNAVDRGRSLTFSLLSFARKSRMALKTVNLAEVLRSFEAVLTRVLLDDIRIETIIHDESLPTLTDVNMLENAILNLAVNARDAMQGGGTLCIEARRMDVRDQADQEAVDIPAGRYIEISVRDTGCGISQENLEQIFNPFFTTKPPGHGSGLGLSMVQGYVAQSGGHTRVRSIPGKGTTVFLYLTEAQAEGAKGAQSEGAEGAQPTAGTRILFVEDDDNVRRATARAIRVSGHQVVECATAQEAMTAFEHGGPFQVALVDNYLGGTILGVKLAQCFRSMDPNVRIVVLSGYVTEELQEDGEAYDMIFLRKPVSRETLLAILAGKK